jgi:hypothetical protein
MDMIVQPLGELRAALWVARGDENRATYGFKEANDRITFEVRDGDKTKSLTLELGGVATNRVPYGLAVVDGQTWIFEIPILTFYEMTRDLLNPLSQKPPVSASMTRHAGAGVPPAQSAKRAPSTRGRRDARPTLRHSDPLQPFFSTPDLVFPSSFPAHALRSLR